MEVSRIHHDTLKSYLASHLKSELAGISMARKSAREKLARLSRQQFQELSTDVYDELLRRQKDTSAGMVSHWEDCLQVRLWSSVPFLPLRDEFHPKRNQARQKLATLPVHRFKDLASDVFAEIERRYPQLITSKSPSESKREKAPAAEDDEAAPLSHGSERKNTNGKTGNLERPTTESLEHLMNDLGNMMEKPFPIPTDQPFTLNGDGSDVRQCCEEHEKEINSLRQKLEELEGRLSDHSKREDPDEVAKLNREIAELKTLNDQQRSSLEVLEAEFTKLEEEHQRQQQLVDEKLLEIERTEAKNRELLASNGALQEKCQEYEEKISNLTDELREVKDELAKVPPSHPTVALNDFCESPLLMAFPEGAIEFTRVNEYQEAIDELMEATRSNTPTHVLIAMKSIVLACKKMTEDIEFHEKATQMPPAIHDRLYQLKAQLSNTLTDLMNAAKSHATGFGVSPTSILNSAAINLTITIVELIRLLKLKPLPESSANAGSSLKEPLASPGSSKKGSSSLYNEQQEDNGKPLDNSNPEYGDFKVFLEEKTDSIVQEIQRLLELIRSGTFDERLGTIVENINAVVAEVADVSKKSLSVETQPTYQSQVDTVIENLLTSSNRLYSLKDSFAQTTTEPSSGSSGVAHAKVKSSKQRIASAAWEIAKSTKELVSLSEQKPR